MTPLMEQLSQLLSGDLPEAEAEALRRRIATEPEVAARWERLCAAIEALDELPTALPPPPLRSPAERPPAPGRSLRWLLPSLLAAAAALGWLRPEARPELVLAEGSQWAEGEVRLLAGDAVVEVDGQAWISVEPGGRTERVGIPSVEDPMDKSTWMAGLAGAVVTVAVYEGTAVVRAESAPEGVVVAAGQIHRTRPRAAPGAVPPTPEARAENVARLEAELAEVQQALEEARFEGALTRGQLLAIQGEPSPWPADAPPELRPDRFRAELEARLAELPDVAVAEVDCAEYPCVAALQYTGAADDEDWNKPMGEAVRSWLEGVIGEQMSISTNTSRFSDGERVERYVIFGAHPEDRSSAIGDRTEYRIDAMVDVLGQQMQDRAPED